ncbi:hypothetical protein ISCGN_012654 [Ixodes scapularis]
MEMSAEKTNYITIAATKARQKGIDISLTKHQRPDYPKNKRGKNSWSHLPGRREVDNLVKENQTLLEARHRNHPNGHQQNMGNTRTHAAAHPPLLVSRAMYGWNCA